MRTSEGQLDAPKTLSMPRIEADEYVREGAREDS